MGKKITLFASIQIVPITTQDPTTGEEEEGKQIILTDPDAGEIYLYPMVKELVQEVKKKLTMSNKSLAACLEEEARQQQARAQLLQENGGMQMPGEEKVVDDILKGVHRKEEGT